MEEQKVYTLSTGVKFKTRPMASIIIYDVQRQIPLPEPPLIKIKQRGQDRLVEDYTNPYYVDRMEEAQRDRNIAAMDAMIRFGVELVSPLPDNMEWLQNLQSVLDLSRFEDDGGDITLDNLKYIYLRYVAMLTAADYTLVSGAVMPTQEEVAEAVEQFPADA